MSITTKVDLPETSTRGNSSSSSIFEIKSSSMPVAETVLAISSSVGLTSEIQQSGSIFDSFSIFFFAKLVL